MLNKAIQLAAEKHTGLDKSGVPYILHPLTVMQAVSSIEAKTVAVLHDVVEDTTVTLRDLVDLGFPQDIVDAVSILSGTWGDWYWNYIIKCKGNPLARQVKIADLEHNFNLPRTLCRPGKIAEDVHRLKKYALSWQFLNDKITEDEFLTSIKTGRKCE